MFIGKAIKSYRLSKGLTLQALSTLSGISKSMLSEIENDKKTPSIDLTIRISNALEISILNLITDEQPKVTAVHTKAGEHLTLTEPAAGLNLHFISLQGKPNEPQFAFGTMLPNSKTIIYPPSPVSTATYFYIIQGILNIRLGETTYKLSKGDSLYYKTDIEQQLFTEGAEECHFVTLRLYQTNLNN